MSISAEKLNYLKGITDGMNLSEATSEGKLFVLTSRTGIYGRGAERTANGSACCFPGKTGGS